jgi:two-component system response regulator AtoC
VPVPATVLENSSVGPTPGGYQLLVMDPERFVTHSLPISGTLTIGRGDQVDVRLTDPLASRSHARLHVGATFELEDLDSSNKTRLHDAPLAAWQRTVVAPGEAFSIGATMLMIQQRGGILPRPRRMWPHGYFEARLEEECARSESSRDPFAVVRVHVEGAETPARVAELIRMALRLPDMLAEYAPGEYEVLLADTEAPFASAIAQDITAKLREAGLQSRTGLAIFPRDGQSPEELIGVACTRVRGVEETSNAVVVQDALMERLYSLADRAAKGTISVLIVGETGVGKEVMAERIHKLSPRANKPFLCLNCASLSENLLTSELFGHERGAFTGAVEAKPGLLETAPGGTVFLDEVGELPLALQVTLLRVLETRVVMRVGGVKPRSIDVRFVAATNCDLESDVAAGKFRRDLYFRLNGIMLQIPPLRARRVEIQPLAKTFLEQFSGQLGRSRPLRLGTEALRFLESYVWPGNIRELRNVIERASLLCAGDEILPEHLPLEAMTAASSMVQARVPAPPVESFGAGAWNPLASPPWARSQTSPPSPASVAPARAAAPASSPETERERILRVLAEHGGNQTRAAAALGMARSTLVLRLNSYNIVRPRKP